MQETRPQYCIRVFDEVTGARYDARDLPDNVASFLTQFDRMPEEDELRRIVSFHYEKAKDNEREREWFKPRFFFHRDNFAGKIEEVHMFGKCTRKCANVTVDVVLEGLAIIDDVLGTNYLATIEGEAADDEQQTVPGDVYCFLSHYPQSYLDGASLDDTLRTVLEYAISKNPNVEDVADFLGWLFSDKVYTRQLTKAAEKQLADEEW